MAAQPIRPRDDDPYVPADLGSLQPCEYLGPESACPAEYVGVPIQELIAQIEAERRERAIAADQECLPAGFLPRAARIPARSGSGFESGGVLDVSAPDGMLAGLTDAVTRDGRLGGLDDDELIGVIRAWCRLESWCNANLLTALAELARRRPAERTPAAPPGSFPEQVSEFAVDEIAAALTLSGQAASTYLALALDQAIRLPGTARAQHAGHIGHLKARLIAEATRILTDDHAREVEARVLPAAAGQTLGQLRAAVARAVLAVDPDAAARRREEAQKDPRVRRWQEDAGTAALAGYSLPPAEVLEADQRLTARAIALREAGVTGSLEELRARAYLDALLGHESASPAGPEGSENPQYPEDPTAPTDPADPARASDPAEAAGRGGPARARRSARVRSSVNLTVPLGSALGAADAPGVVAGFGPVDAPLARQLLEAAAADPATRYCITLTGQDGRAIGHGCLPGPGALTKLTAQNPAQPLSVTITPLAQGICDHRHQEPGYQPSRRLQHLIRARNPTCTAPGCPRPAARCDLDHTTPYDQGGRTCECNLAPLCRRHHRCKQAQGWRLEQPQPGVLHWITPAGRHYVTVPGAYW